MSQPLRRLPPEAPIFSLERGHDAGIPLVAGFLQGRRGHEPPTSPCTGVPARPDTAQLPEDPAKRACLEAIGQIYLAVGSAGAQWEEIPQSQASARLALILRGPCRLSLGRLRAIVRGWRSWFAWAASPEGLGLQKEVIPAFRPTSTQFGIYLQATAQRGPTVAPARLSALAWLQFTTQRSVQGQAAPQGLGAP